MKSAEGARTWSDEKLRSDVWPLVENELSGDVQGAIDAIQARVRDDQRLSEDDKSALSTLAEDFKRQPQTKRYGLFRATEQKKTKTDAPRSPKEEYEYEIAHTPWGHEYHAALVFGRLCPELDKERKGAGAKALSANRTPINDKGAMAYSVKNTLGLLASVNKFIAETVAELEGEWRVRAYTRMCDSKKLENSNFYLAALMYLFEFAVGLRAKDAAVAVDANGDAAECFVSAIAGDGGAIEINKDATTIKLLYVNKTTKKLLQNAYASKWRPSNVKPDLLLCMVGCVVKHWDKIKEFRTQARWYSKKVTGKKGSFLARLDPSNHLDTKSTTIGAASSDMTANWTHVSAFTPNKLRSLGVAYLPVTNGVSQIPAAKQADLTTNFPGHGPGMNHDPEYVLFELPRFEAPSGRPVLKFGCQGSEMENELYVEQRTPQPDAQLQVDLRIKFAGK